MTNQQLETARRLRAQGKTLKEIGSEIGLTYSTVSVALSSHQSKTYEKRHCDTCGLLWTPTYETRQRRTCSQACETFLRRKIHFVNGPCEYCGGVIVADPAHGNNPRRFCGNPCAQKWKKGKTPLEIKRASDRFDMKVAITHENAVQEMQKLKEKNIRERNETTETPPSTNREARRISQRQDHVRAGRGREATV